MLLLSLTFDSIASQILLHKLSTTFLHLYLAFVSFTNLTAMETQSKQSASPHCLRCLAIDHELATCPEVLPDEVPIVNHSTQVCTFLKTPYKTTTLAEIVAGIARLEEAPRSHVRFVTPFERYNLDESKSQSLHQLQVNPRVTILYEIVTTSEHPPNNSQTSTESHSSSTPRATVGNLMQENMLLQYYDVCAQMEAYRLRLINQMQHYSPNTPAHLPPIPVPVLPSQQQQTQFFPPSTPQFSHPNPMPTEPIPSTSLPPNPNIQPHERQPNNATLYPPFPTVSSQEDDPSSPSMHSPLTLSPLSSEHEISSPQLSSFQISSSQIPSQILPSQISSQIPSSQIPSPPLSSSTAHPPSSPFLPLPPLPHALSPPLEPFHDLHALVEIHVPALHRTVNLKGVGLASPTEQIYARARSYGVILKLRRAPVPWGPPMGQHHGAHGFAHVFVEFARVGSCQELLRVGSFWVEGRRVEISMARTAIKDPKPGDAIVEEGRVRQGIQVGSVATESFSVSL